MFINMFLPPLNSYFCESSLCSLVENNFDFLWLLNICRGKSAATILPQAERYKSPKPQKLSCFNASTTYILIFFLSPSLNSPWKKKNAWELILMWMKKSATRDLLISSFTVSSLLSLVSVALPGLEQASVVLFWITYSPSHIQFLSFISFKRSRILNQGEYCAIINMQVAFKGSCCAGTYNTWYSTFFLLSHIIVIKIN